MLVTTYLDNNCVQQNSSYTKQLTCVNSEDTSFMLRCTNSNSRPSGYVSQEIYLDPFCANSLGWVDYKTDYCIDSVLLTCASNGLIVGNYAPNSTIGTCDRLINSTLLPFDSCVVFPETDNFVKISPCTEPLINEWWFWLAIGGGALVFIIGFTIIIIAILRANKGYQVIN